MWWLFLVGIAAGMILNAAIATIYSPSQDLALSRDEVEHLHATLGRAADALSYCRDRLAKPPQEVRK